MPDPKIHVTTNTRWMTEHQGVSRTVARLYDVSNFWADGSAPAEHVWTAGLAGLKSVLVDARGAGKRVRPIGGNWSLSEIAATTDFMVNTEQLNARTIGLDPNMVVPGSPFAPGHLVFVQCGTSIIELNDALEARGLALKTSGASNGQTMAGAIATGTHGAANSVGAMQEYVVGLHVLRPDGTTAWVERQSRPVASDALVALLGATAIRDDRVFRAAVVGLGAFGIVHAVVIEVEPIYLLERYVQRFDYDELRPVLSTLDVTSLRLPPGAELPFHFEVLLNPYAIAAGGRGAYVRAMYKRAFNQPSLPAPGSVVRTGPGDDVLSVITQLTHVLPAAIPAAVGAIVALQAPLANGQRATPGQTFGATTLKGPGTSMEVAVSLADATKAVDVLAHLASARTFAGPFGIRFVRSTDALLGFTRMGPITCTVEMPGTLTQQTHDTYDALLIALDTAGIAYTLHWGQSQPATYDVAHLRARYGDDIDSWVNSRRALIPDAAERLLLSNDVTDRFGLGT